MWLPRPLYEAVPYAWMLAGAAALGAAWLAPQWPRSLLLALGTAALTLGLVLWMRRRDFRASQRDYDARALDD